MIHLDIVMIIPRLPSTVPHLHEANTAFDQTARDQHLPALHPRPVHVAHGLGFSGNIKSVLGIRLHAPSQFERLDPRFKATIVFATRQVLAIHAGQQIELGALVRRSPSGTDVFHQLFKSRVLGIDIGSLINTRQKSRLPVLSFLNGVTTRTHRNKARQVLIFTTQAVGHPRSHAGTDLPGIAAIKQQQRWFVVGHIRVHGAHNT